MIERNVIGIVLEKYVFEDEHIIKILIENGDILSLKAKGLDSLHSKNRMAIFVFNEVEFEYFTSNEAKGNTGRLKRATLINEFTNISERNSLLIEVVRNIILGQEKNSNLTYQSLKKIINLFKVNDYNFQSLYELIILTLRQNGYLPIVDKCVKCNSNQLIMGFSIYEGGLICNKHLELKKYFLPAKTLRKIIEINSLKNPLECRNLNFDQLEVAKIKSMCKLFLENQLGINVYLL